MAGASISLHEAPDVGHVDVTLVTTRASSPGRHQHTIRSHYYRLPSAHPASLA